MCRLLLLLAAVTLAQAVMRRREEVVLFDKDGNPVKVHRAAMVDDESGESFSSSEDVREGMDAELAAFEADLDGAYDGVPEDPFEALDEDHEVGDLLELDDVEFSSMYGEELGEQMPPSTEEKEASEDKKEALIIVFADGTTSTMPFDGKVAGLEELLEDVRELYWLKDGIVKEYLEADRESGIEAWFYGGHPSAGSPKLVSRFVETLTDADFDARLNARDFWIIFFHAPWCSHCRKLDPVFSKLADFIKGKLPEELSSQYHLAKVDAEANPVVAARWGVTSYPTVFLAVNGKRYKFQGKRDLVTLTNWVRMDFRSSPEQGDVPAATSKGGAVPVNDDDVLVVTEDTFEGVVSSGDALLIEFYAPWCGWCKKLAPLWAQLSSLVKRDHPKLKVAKVDATKNKKLAARLGVQGFPTIIKLRGKRFAEHNGPRTIESFVAFLQSDAPLTSELEEPGSSDDVQVLTDDSFDVALKSDVPLYMCVVASWCGHCKAFKPTMDSVATRLKQQHEGQWVIARLDGDENPQTAARLGVEGFPTCFYFPKDGRVYDYTGTRSIAGLQDFLFGKWRDAPSRAVPVNPDVLEEPASVVHLQDATFYDATKEGTWFIFFHSPACGFCKKMQGQFSLFAERVAELGDASLRVAKVNAGEEEEIAHRFAIDGYPSLYVYTGGSEAYPFPDGVSERTAEKFLAFIRGGYKQATPQTLQVPEAELDGHESDVVTLTAEDIEERTSSGVWFVEFYTTWCSHCKSLAPRWAKLATWAKRQGADVRVAKFECGQHPDVERAFHVDGYPTLMRVEGHEVRECTRRGSLKLLQRFINGGWEAAQAKRIQWPEEKEDL